MRRGLLFALFLVLLSGSGRAQESDLGPLVDLLGQIEEPEARLDILKGMHEGLRGRKNVPMPKGWPDLYSELAKSKNAEIRERARILGLIFGDPQVLRALRASMLDPESEIEERKTALRALVEKRVKDLAPSLHELLKDKKLRNEALRGLAAFDHPSTPKHILSLYAELSEGEKQDAISTLASRPVYAMALLDAMEAKTIPRQDLSAFQARQLQNLGHAEVIARLKKVWGEVRQPAQDRQKLIAKYKDMLPEKFLSRANKRNGRVIFEKTCAQCHTLHGTGGKIGPDLTGSNRDNLDYILENVLAPSALIGRDYRLTNVYLDNGRVIPGLILERTKSRVTIQTANEQVIISPEDVEKEQVTATSMMPDGLFDKLKREEIRDLIGYLAHREQVPLPREQVPLPPGVEVPSE